MAAPTPSLRLITVPYDSGRRGVRHGAGPDALVAGGAVARLARAGRPVDRREVTCGPLAAGEAAADVEVMRAVRALVADAVEDRAAPVVLAGNCGATLGVVAGLPAPRVGVLWLDAHGDLNDPRTSASGFVDGMSLSMLTGRSWTGLTQRVPGFAPVADADVLLVGAHELDPAERELLDRSRIGLLTVDALRDDPAAVTRAVTALVDGVDAVHVHVDLDVHDLDVGRANSWSAPGGLRPEEVRAVIRAAADRAPVRSATLASWDPALDDDHRMRDVALDLVELLGAALTH
ncbi:arginase family protein [Cellulomonas xylanilytica]|uniref:Arginase n=1 Tax=Cellulomonas xylanilytica TaxID=233583 RepID=A0A510V2E5_9CELL|nr:arginase family protein [Cellulomonas xylanilytica]GEK21054.1 arginase [Cellulomonas xylanilytica]